MPTATTGDGGAVAPADVATPKLDAGSKDASQMKYDSVEGGHATDQLKLDSFSGGGGPSGQLGGGGGASKVITTPGTADTMKYDVRHDKWDVPPGVTQNKIVQPDAYEAYHLKITPPATVPGAGPTQPK